MKKSIIVRLEKYMLNHMPKKMAHSLIYFRSHYKIMNWNTPSTYDEKIHWLIVNVYDEKYGKFADKYEVREFIKQCELENLLVKLYGVYESEVNIDISKLPNKFILKTTQGSGSLYYELVKDKSIVNIDMLKEKFKNALAMDMSYRRCEYHYKSIVPRIICEELLEDKEHDRLTDYKVVCSFGKPYAILVCSDRDEGRDYFDTEWNYLEYTKKKFRSKYEIKKPKCLSKMLEYAAILSKDFPLARIDFYVVKDKIYFGEITLTPSAGCHRYLTEFGQRELGKMIKLNK